MDLPSWVDFVSYAWKESPMGGGFDRANSEPFATVRWSAPGVGLVLFR
jgi:hypothetical protein